MLRKVAFTMYPVRDVARAREFYEGALGLAPGLKGNRGDQWWIEYDLPGGGCFAITNFTGNTPGTGTGGIIAFEVEDLDRLVAGLKARDAQFLGDIVHGPNCRMITCQDSEGNAIVLHQISPKH